MMATGAASSAPTMDWKPIASGVWEAQGYRIAAFHLNEGWIYGLFAPPLPDKEFDNQLKTRYALGESVPQRRALLGQYVQPAAAREAAEQHRSGEISAHAEPV